LRGRGGVVCVVDVDVDVGVGLVDDYRGKGFLGLFGGVVVGGVVIA
jgi:hypothetical protein